MINIRKIVLLSALLMSASSFIAPTYAMLDDEQGASASRITHAQVPLQLTPEMISEIKQYGSFFAEGREYVLKNPEKLESFAKYLNPERRQDSFQRSIAGENLLNYQYLVQTCSLIPNPNYDPASPEGTESKWIDTGNGGCFLYSLHFKQNPAPAKPLAVVPKIEEQEIGSGAAASSVPAPMSSDSSSEDVVKAMIIRSLTETYKSDPEALGKALAAFLANLK